MGAGIDHSSLNCQCNFERCDDGHSFSSGSLNFGPEVIRHRRWSVIHGSRMSAMAVIQLSLSRVVSLFGRDREETSPMGC